MDGILKRSHWFILAAVIISVIAFISRPSYAGGAFSEVPCATKTTSFDAASGKATVTLKWSKAYSRMKNGKVEDVTGYQIQYAKNKKFKNAVKVSKGSKSRKAVIKLADLSTQEAYDSGINEYHFRIGSYVKVNGKKVYSDWTEAAEVQSMKTYSPVTLKAISADRNTVKGEWAVPSGAEGYIVFGKKAGAKTWKKKAVIDDPECTDFSDEGLTYSCEYVYSVVSYRMESAEDPARLTTSYLKILDNAENVYRVSTAAFSVDKPKLRAVFDGDVLNTTWTYANGADSYLIQISNKQDFPKTEDTRTFNVDSDMIIDGMNSYTMEHDDLDHESYYVRVRATGHYKKKTYRSEWSDVKFAKFGAGVYTIVFDGNGATSGSMKESSVSEAEDYELPANAYSRKGYQFAGWCTEPSNQLYLDTEQPIQIGMTEYQDQSTVKDLTAPGESVTLYACWKGSGPDAAADWADTIAADDEFSYGPEVKNHCWFCQGGNKYYICNALVAAAYTHGMPYFSGYKSGSTDYSWWLKKGFTDVGENAPVEDIRKGDLICCWNGSRWSHIMIALTDGTEESPLVVHASSKGTGPETIREDNMVKRISKYKKYHVVRCKE